MNKVNEQKLVTYIGYVLAGILAFGALLDALVNAQVFFTIKSSIYLSSFLLFLWAIIKVWIALRKPEYKNKEGVVFRIKKLNHYYTLFTLGVILLIWFPHIITLFSSKTSSNAFVPIFSKTDNHYKILILPFNQMCGQYRDVGLAIKANLDKRAKKDTLNIKSVYVDSLKKSDLINEKYAEQFKDKHNADMVIFGNYLTQECSANNTDEYCYNYIANVPIGFSSTIRSTEFDFQPSNYSDILKKRLSGNLNYMVYYIQAIYSLSLKNSTRAIKYLKEALLNTTIHSQDVYSQLINLLCQEERFDEAREFLDSQMRNSNILEIDSTFYLKYLLFSSIVDYRAKQYEDAVKDSRALTKSLKNFNRFDDEFLLLTIYEFQTKLYTYLGYKEDAKFALEKGVEIELREGGISPNTIFQYIHLAFHSMNLSIVEKLLDEVDANLVKDSSSSLAAFNIPLLQGYYQGRKNLYLLKGENALGLEYWDKLIEWREKYYKGNKETIASYYLKGRYHLSLGEYEKAISTLEKGFYEAKLLGDKGYLLTLCFSSRLYVAYERINQKQKGDSLVQIVLQKGWSNSIKPQNEYIDLVINEELQNFEADRNILAEFDGKLLTGKNLDSTLYRQVHFFLLH